MSSMSARDKKIMLAIVPVAVVLAFWFLLLSPKRAEVSQLDGQVAAAQQQRDEAVTKAGSLETARETYAKDYETVVRLGKAVPSTIDMPSLLVQLDSAAKGTKIKFVSVKAGDRTAAPAASTTTTSSGSSSAPPVAAGGAQAQSGAGQSAEKANNAAATSDQANSNANQSPPANGSSTTPSTTTPGASTGTPDAGATGAQGLDSVPLDFTFTGSYFDLADFFHRMKRFVRMARGDVQVKGRLLTIDKVKFDSTSFPKIKADITATVYLSPKSQGTNAGGTPAGPQATGGNATPTPAASTGSTTTPTPTPAPASGGSPQ